MGAPDSSSPHPPSDSLLLSHSEYGLTTLNSTSTPRTLYLFGNPIATSLSPLFHNSIFANLGLPWTYALHESSEISSFLPLMHAPSFIGASITMPHKIAFLEQCTHLTPAAVRIGAMNTLFVRLDPSTGERRYIGTNTDCVGAKEALVRNHPELQERQRGRPALVIGGGGACRAAVYAVGEMMGASIVYLVSRDAAEVDAVVAGFKSTGFKGQLLHVSSVEQARSLAAPVCIVGTVPNYPPVSEGEISAREIVLAFLEKKEKGVVLEACYFPRVWTAFAELAKAHEWEVVKGTEMMLYQGFAQDALWTEKRVEELPAEVVKETIRAVVEKNEQ